MKKILIPHLNSYLPHLSNNDIAFVFVILLRKIYSTLNARVTFDVMIDRCFLK